MITVKVRRKKKKLQRVAQSIKRLDGQSTQIGYFAQQGLHSGGEYSYVALAQAVEIGYFPKQKLNRVPMPFMNIIGDKVARGVPVDAKVRGAFRKWGKRLDRGVSPNKLLNAVGEVGLTESKGIFNNPAYFPQAPHNKTPLFESGDFAAHFAYKNTVTNIIKEV